MFRNFDYFENMMHMTPFRKILSCYPVSFMDGKDRTDVDDGGKIILPPSALDELARRNIQYPMLFKLTNTTDSKSTHCGVLEFVADEGKAFLPYWMMTNLLLSEGGQVTVENVSLPTATYVKIQPQSTDFLDISNPKAVLEKALRSFACLTAGDMIAINYNNKGYELSVLELRPANAVSIIECDMDVDFAPPVGYKEPEMKPRESQCDNADDEEDSIDYSAIKDMRAGFQVFSCEGVRLDGKKMDSRGPQDSQTSTNTPHTRGIPNYDYKKGKITFHRNTRAKAETSDDPSKVFSAFQGEGQNLKTRKTRAK